MAGNVNLRKRTSPGSFGAGLVLSDDERTIEPPQGDYTRDRGPGKVETVGKQNCKNNPPYFNKRYVVNREGVGDPAPDSAIRDGVMLRAPMGNMSGTFGDIVDEYEEEFSQ